jgi:predicted metal-dependent peptidase
MLLQEEFSPDYHSLWPALKEDQNRKQPPVKTLMLQKKWEDLSGKMMTQMESFSVEASTQDSSLLEQTQVENRERISYRSFLRKFAVLREEMHMDPDSYDSILYSLGLEMYGNMPLIEPVETREVRRIDEFVIVIDTSMSVSGRLVKSFLEQTYSVLSESESFLRKVNIRILMCDEQVLSDRKIESKKDLEEYMQHIQLVGEGGTDFRPAFAYVDDLIRKKQFLSLRGLLYFTDGKGIYPAKKPPYETAFIFCAEDYDDSAVPPWAIRLILPAWQLEEEKRLEDERFIWSDQER